jgi:isopropylmalate/homocitrate/citramalate synthase
MSRFPEVWFCPSFATQSTPEVLNSMLDAVASTGVRHFNLPDSSGVAVPEEIVELVRPYAQRGWELGIHCHNDFGLCLANTVAGLGAGARYADVTVNGYGERAGNCSLEQLSVALVYLFGASVSVDLSRLRRLSQEVAARAGREIAPDAAIVGRDAFAQKLDAHVRLTELDPTMLEPFDPALVGNERRVAIGPGSGEHSLTRKIQLLGVDEPDMRAVALALPRIITQVEEDKFISDDSILAAYERAAAECDVPT